MIFEPRLEGPRLWLRPFRVEDAPALAELYADPVTMRFIGGVRTMAQVHEELEHTLAGYEIHGFGPRAVIRREDDVFVGRCGLWLQEVDGVRELEIGYLVGPAHRGRGYASEAAVAIRDAAWRAGATRLVALVDPANGPSQRVAARLGMRRERTTTWRGAMTEVWSVEPVSPEGAAQRTRR